MVRTLPAVTMLYHEQAEGVGHDVPAPVPVCGGVIAAPNLLDGVGALDAPGIDDPCRGDRATLVLILDRSVERVVDLIGESLGVLLLEDEYTVAHLRKSCGNSPPTKTVPVTYKMVSTIRRSVSVLGRAADRA